MEFWENGIVYVEIEPNTEIDVPLNKLHQNVFMENYIEGNPYFILANLGKFTTVTKESREFSASPETNKIRAAVAVVFTSLAQRLTINFQVKFISHQKTKMKAFQHKEDGIKWLLDLKNKS